VLFVKFIVKFVRHVVFTGGIVRGRVERKLKRGRGEWHDQRERLDVPDELPAGRHLGI
jgi:hypothetical protein